MGLQRVGHDLTTKQQTTCVCVCVCVCVCMHISASWVVLVVKNLPANAGDIKDAGSISGLGRSPGGENFYPLQYSCLENQLSDQLLCWVAAV